MKKYNLVRNISKALGKKIKFKILDKYTLGAPQTVLSIRDLILEDEPIFIDLLDQYLDLKDFYNFCLTKNLMDVFLFFNHFIMIGVMILAQIKDKKISEKNKNPISTNSTGCISYFKKAKDFFYYCNIMINKNQKSANGKFMISLVYNEMIKQNYNIKGYDCEFVASLGSVNSLKSFAENCRLINY